MEEKCKNPPENEDSAKLQRSSQGERKACDQFAPNKPSDVDLNVQQGSKLSSQAAAGQQNKKDAVVDSDSKQKKSTTNQKSKKQRKSNSDSRQTTLESSFKPLPRRKEELLSTQQRVKQRQLLPIKEREHELHDYIPHQKSMPNNQLLLGHLNQQVQFTGQGQNSTAVVSSQDIAGPSIQDNCDLDPLERSNENSHLPDGPNDQGERASFHQQRSASSSQPIHGPTEDGERDSGSQSISRSYSQPISSPIKLRKGNSESHQRHMANRNSGECLTGSQEGFAAIPQPEPRGREKEKLETDLQQKTDSGFSPKLEPVKGTRKRGTRKREANDDMQCSTPKKKTKASDTMTVSPKKVHETSNQGIYYEENVASHIFSNLCAFKGAYDWSLGMQKEDMFPKFDDIVVGFKKSAEKDFEYFAIQLKAYDNKEGTKVITYSSKTLLDVKINKRTGEQPFNLWNYFRNGFVKINKQLLESTNRLILYTQHKLQIQPKHADLFEDLSCEPLQEISTFLPPISKTDPEEEPRIMKRICRNKIVDLVKIWMTQYASNRFSGADDEKALKREFLEKIVRAEERSNSNDIVNDLLKIWKEEEGSLEEINMTEELIQKFIEKVAFVSEQQSSRELHDFGEKILKDRWNALFTNISKFRHDGSRPWVSKIELMNQEITFQGDQNALRVSELLDEPYPMLLMSLFINSADISVGIAVRGLKEIKKYYITRKFNQRAGRKKVLEEELIAEDVIIIEGQAGLGKSVALCHAAEELKRQSDAARSENSEEPILWIIELNAEAVFHAFSNNSSETDPFKLLQECILAKNDSIERALIEKLRTSEHSKVRIAIFLDGLDEVSMEYTSAVIKCLRALHASAKFKKIWVSTRNNLKSKVEKALGTKAFTMSPFVEKDQLNFLSKFWNIERGTPKFRPFVKKIFGASLVSGELKKFIGIPLLTMMFAEIYADEVGKVLKSKIAVKNWEPETLNRNSLFEKFAEKKFEVEYAKYDTNSSGNTQFREGRRSREEVAFFEHHELVSFKNIFQKYEGFSSTISNGNKEATHAAIANLQAGKMISGLISGFQAAVQVNFSHQLSAEHFAARALFKILQRLRGEEQFFKERPPQLKRLIEFLRTHHTKPENENVKVFMSYKAAEAMKMHTKALDEIRKASSEPEGVSWDYHARDLAGHLLEEDLLGRQIIHLALESDMLRHANWLLVDNRTFMADNVWDSILRNKWLLFACNQNDPELVQRVLLESEVDVNHKNPNGDAALHMAADHEDAVIAELLITEYRADVSIANNTGITPLHVSCRKGHILVAETLIENGAEINVPDHDGTFPLHTACLFGHLILAEILLRKGADKTKTNSNGYIPLELVSEGKKPKFEQLFSEDLIDIRM